MTAIYRRIRSINNGTILCIRHLSITAHTRTEKIELMNYCIPAMCIKFTLVRLPPGLSEEDG